MARPEKLSEAQVREELLNLDGWALTGDGLSLERHFQFSDFSQAFGFMARAALLAEKMDHHPEWFNVYNRVEVRMTTHDAGGVTSFDLDMARAMNQYAKS